MPPPTPPPRAAPAEASRIWCSLCSSYKPAGEFETRQRVCRSCRSGVHKLARGMSDKGLEKEFKLLRTHEHDGCFGKLVQHHMNMNLEARKEFNFLKWMLYNVSPSLLNEMIEGPGYQFYDVYRAKPRSPTSSEASWSDEPPDDSASSSAGPSYSCSGLAAEIDSALWEVEETTSVTKRDLPDGGTETVIEERSVRRRRIL